MLANFVARMVFLPAPVAPLVLLAVNGSCTLSVTEQAWGDRFVVS